MKCQKEIEAVCIADLSMAHTGPESITGGDFKNETTCQTNTGQSACAQGGGAGFGNGMHRPDSLRRAYAWTGAKLRRPISHSRTKTLARQRRISHKPAARPIAARGCGTKKCCLDFSVDKSGKVVYTFKSFRRGMV